jgi:hypothetical protein
MPKLKHKHTKPSFEPLVPLGLFLVIFGAIITAVPFMPASWLGQGVREIGEMDKVVNLVSGLSFLIWGGAWFYVGWSRTQKLRQAALQKKDEKL